MLLWLQVYSVRSAQLTLVTRPPFLYNKGSLKVTLVCLGERQGVEGQVEADLTLLPGERRREVRGGGVWGLPVRPDRSIRAAPLLRAESFSGEQLCLFWRSPESLEIRVVRLARVFLAAPRATSRAVKPDKLTRFGSAPASTRVSTRLECPERAAAWRQVQPFWVKVVSKTTGVLMLVLPAEYQAEDCIWWSPWQHSHVPCDKL